MNQICIWVWLDYAKYRKLVVRQQRGRFQLQFFRGGPCSHQKHVKDEKHVMDANMTKENMGMPKLAEIAKQILELATNLEVPRVWVVYSWS